MDGDKPRDDLENDLTALERRLAGWRPATTALSRDRMLFDAGRAAALAESRSRFWQLATAASAMLTLAFGGLFAQERAQRVAWESKTVTSLATREAQPSIPRTPQPPKIEPAERNSYRALNAQLAKDAREIASLEIEPESEPRRHPAASPNSSPSLQPLRVIDVDRVLDL